MGWFFKTQLEKAEKKLFQSNLQLQEAISRNLYEPTMQNEADIASAITAKRAAEKVVLFEEKKEENKFLLG